MSEPTDVDCAALRQAIADSGRERAERECNFLLSVLNDPGVRVTYASGVRERLLREWRAIRMGIDDAR